ncbi:hypothetical protein CEXT_335441 [Caerostris extrusa]|uniref:Uncharacterized protein n=1 Tax=Caerostris extrusa TaxID=172846 RepID=A0AAV4XPB9_CAEEX|nr:hypothetical protein CEXT_335441 [Caerostris extrusa]
MCAAKYCGSTYPSTRRIGTTREILRSSAHFADDYASRISNNCKAMRFKRENRKRSIILDVVPRQIVPDVLPPNNEQTERTYKITSFCYIIAFYVAFGCVLYLLSKYYPPSKLRRSANDSMLMYIEYID